MDWLDQLNDALGYIEQHLDGEIEIKQMARLAHCSDFHFQRMFSYVMDIPLAEYIRRRRMTKAADDLRNTTDKIVDIALRYGYDSPTSFNRAFQSVHGIAPSAARAEGAVLKAYPPISFKYNRQSEVAIMSGNYPTNGVEIDFVVEDSLTALALYEKIFEVERVEVTEFPKGQNEAIFTLYGTRFHMLDENQNFNLFAPKIGQQATVWFNVIVPDIAAVHLKALENGCKEVQAVTEIESFGIINSVFSDTFGYVWMLHQVQRVVGFEERVEYFKNQTNGDLS